MIVYFAADDLFSVNLKAKNASTAKYIYYVIISTISRCVKS